MPTCDADKDVSSVKNASAEEDSFCCIEQLVINNKNDNHLYEVFKNNL
jgi:hypothetical protein